MSDAIAIRATLKKAGGRPARDPGDKPIFELTFRSEVNPWTAAIMAQLGKEFDVRLEPVPDAQATLPWEDEPVRTTVVDGSNGLVLESVVASVLNDEEGWDGSVSKVVLDANRVEVPSAGRRRRGTRANVVSDD